MSQNWKRALSVSSHRSKKQRSPLRLRFLTCTHKKHPVLRLQLFSKEVLELFSGPSHREDRRDSRCPPSACPAGGRLWRFFSQRPYFYSQIYHRTNPGPHKCGAYFPALREEGSGKILFYLYLIKGGPPLGQDPRSGEDRSPCCL